MLKKTVLAAAVGWLLAGGSTALADSAVINFTSFLSPGGFSAEADVPNPNALNPYEPGTEFNNLVQGLFGPGQGAGENLDWLRFTGQIYIPNFQGDGTYTITPDNGVGGIYLHSPLLNRIEAVSLRTEGPISTESQLAGARRLDGAQPTQRDDFYFPDFTPNGTATVVISGNSVDIDYVLDFDSLNDDLNSQFFRQNPDETLETDLSRRLLAADQQFGKITVSSGDQPNTAVVTQATIGDDDPLLPDSGEGALPYGAYNPLDSTISGNLGNTIVDLTRFIVATEIGNDNISADGQQTGEPDAEFTPNPFAGESGTAFYYNLLGDGDLVTTVEMALIPEPGTAALLLAAASFMTRRRRRAA